jgi:F-type H+-transporting ATPase subunit c
MLQDAQNVASGISGAGEGITAAHALDGMARQPEMQGALLRTMLLGQAVAESTGIYSLLIAIVLLFVV